MSTPALFSKDYGVPTETNPAGNMQSPISRRRRINVTSGPFYYFYFLSFIFISRCLGNICSPWPQVYHQSILEICRVDEPAFVAIRPSWPQRITTSPLPPEDRLALEERRASRKHNKNSVLEVFQAVGTNRV